MKNNILLPIAIILSAVTVSGTILYAVNSLNTQGSIVGNTAPRGDDDIPNGTERTVKVDATETDPAIGNSDAPVTIESQRR